MKNTQKKLNVKYANNLDTQSELRDCFNPGSQAVLLEEIAERSLFLFSMWEYGIDPADENTILGKYDQELVQAAIDVNKKYHESALTAIPIDEYTALISLFEILNSAIIREDFEYMALLVKPENYKRIPMTKEEIKEGYGYAITAEEILVDQILEHNAFLNTLLNPAYYAEYNGVTNVAQYDKKLAQAAYDLNAKYRAAAHSSRKFYEYARILNLYKVINSEEIEKNFERMTKI